MLQGGERGRSIRHHGKTIPQPGARSAWITLDTVQAGFYSQGLALIHQPGHFGIAESLISYRDELGKRPPVASLELLWTAHQGPHRLISGFVHPPTESRAWEALKLAGETDLITVKGLEGGTDLPIGRACITARVQGGQSERLILHPRDHGCHSNDVEWTDLTTWQAQALEALQNRGPFGTPCAGTLVFISGLWVQLWPGNALEQPPL